MRSSHAVAYARPWKNQAHASAPAGRIDHQLGSQLFGTDRHVVHAMATSLVRAGVGCLHAAAAILHFDHHRVCVHLCTECDDFGMRMFDDVGASFLQQQLQTLTIFW